MLSLEANCLAHARSVEEWTLHDWIVFNGNLVHVRGGRQPRPEAVAHLLQHPVRPCLHRCGHRRRARLGHRADFGR